MAAAWGTERGIDMKITGYQPTIQLNVGNTPKVQAAGDLNSFGGRGQGLGEVSQGLQQMAAVEQKKIEQDMVTDVTNANIEYNKRINDLLYGDDGLLHKEMGAAKTINEDFVAKEKLIRADVMKLVPKYKKAEIAFNTMTDKDAEQRFNLVSRHSFEQKGKERDFNFSNSVDMSSEIAQNNYAVPSLISAELAKVKTLTWATYGNTKGEEYCKAVYSKAEAGMVVKSIQTAIANGDTESANTLIETFSDKVAPEYLNSIKANLTKIKETNSVLTTAKDIAAKAGYDPVKAREILTGITSIGKVDYQSFKQKLFGNESGGDYNAVNPKSGAIGKYQIMPENWSQWAQDAGLSADAKPTPENQEIIADAKLRPLFEKYGAEGAFVAWYAGEQNAVRWLNGDKTAIGDNGEEYSWDAPQANNHPSVRQYVKNGMTGLAPKEMDASERQTLENAVLGEIDRNNKIKKAQASQVADSVSEMMFEQYKSGVRDPQVYADIAAKYGVNADTFQAANNEAAYYIKLSGGGGKGLTDAEEIKLMDVIDTGQVEDKDLLRTKLQEAGATPEQYNKFLARYDSFVKKDGKYQYDYSALKQGFFKFVGFKDDGLWVGAKEAADDFIEEYKAGHNGAMPSFNQVQDAVNNAGMKPKTSWLGSNKDMAGFEKLKVRQATMINLGWANAEDVGGGQIKITFNDGQTLEMSKDKFNKQMKEIEDLYTKKG